MNAAGCGSAAVESPRRRDWEVLRPSLHAKTEGDADGVHQDSKSVGFQEVRRKVKREKMGINLREE
jgi:hypothetical protein